MKSCKNRKTSQSQKQASKDTYFAEVLMDLMLNRGLSTIDIGMAAGVFPSVVNAWLYGATPKAEYICKLEDNLKLGDFYFADFGRKIKQSKKPCIDVNIKGLVSVDDLASVGGFVELLNKRVSALVLSLAQEQGFDVNFKF